MDWNHGRPSAEEADKAMTFWAKKRRASPPETESIAPSRRPDSVDPAERRVQIAAAQARVTLDKLTKEQTAPWIIALSKEKPE